MKCICPQSQKAALAAYDRFITSYQAKYVKATECLEKDKEWLFTFYDFPAQHWSHLRNDQPHRIQLCYGATSYPDKQGMWFTDRYTDYGLQARYGSPETLAPT
jgi:Transposase, Mutator family